jgi:hypothetical protein
MVIVLVAVLIVVHRARALQIPNRVMIVTLVPQKIRGAPIPNHLPIKTIVATPIPAALIRNHLNIKTMVASHRHPPQKQYLNQMTIHIMTAMKVTKERRRLAQKQIVITNVEIASLMAIPFFNDSVDFQVIALAAKFYSVS